MRPSEVITTRLLDSPGFDRRLPQNLTSGSLNFNVRLAQTTHCRLDNDYEPQAHNGWSKDERSKDKDFIAYLRTTEGRVRLAELFSRYPGVEKTVTTAEDVTWFLRETCTKSSYMCRLLDVLCSDDTHAPLLSPWQLVLLAFLTSPTRRLKVEEVAGSIASISIYWASASRQQELRKLVYSILDTRRTTWTPHDNLFILHNAWVDWFGRMNCEAFSISTGEENHFLTDRWKRGVHQYYHNTPSHSDKRYWDAGTNTSTAISKLSTEIMLLILDQLACIDGLISLKFCSHRRRFEMKWYLQGLQKPAEEELPYIIGTEYLNRFVNLRLVSSEWSGLVATTLFDSKSTIFRDDFSVGKIRPDVHGTWFVPWRGDNEILNLEIVVQYRLLYNPGAGIHTTPLVCASDVLNVSCVPTEGRLHHCLARYNGDDAALNASWFVTSGNGIGLQVRGFSFAVVVEQGSRLRYWKPKVQCFIWKLMTDPTGVPKTGEKYILDLGDVWNIIRY
jgi:hypothetical protein